MNKPHLINLHRLAQQASETFRSALQDGSPDAELGRCARVWAEAEQNLARYRDEQLKLQTRLSGADEQGSAERDSY